MRFLRVRILILIKKIKKIKKMLAFCWNMLYSIFCWRVNEMRTMRSVGQAAKTSPSHGENRGSIPLGTAKKAVLLENKAAFFFAPQENICFGV